MLKSFFSSLIRKIERNITIAVFVFILFFAVVCFFKMDYRGSLDGDAGEYVAIAYNLAKNNVYSSSFDGDHSSFNYHRPPGYPLFLAGLIKVIPQLKESSNWRAAGSGGKLTSDHSLVYFKYVQALLLLMTAFMTAWMVWDYLGRKIPAYFTLWFIGFHPFLERYIYRLYREEFAAFVFMLFSLTLYFAFKKSRLLLFLISGLSLGLLTMVLPQWKYVGLFFIAVSFLYSVINRINVKRTILGLLILSIAWISIFYPWELRNEHITGKKFLSSGGGVVLELRSRYNMMPWTSYFASFAYWSRSPILKKSLIKFVDKKYYTPLVRDDKNGLYHLSRVEYNQLYKQKGPLKADSILKRRAIHNILAHPIRHLLMSIPIGFRLMMNPMLSILYIPVYFLFVYAVFFSFRNKNSFLFMVLFPTFAMFIFNSLATHGLTRYNGAYAPILIFGAVIGFNKWWNSSKAK